MVVELAMDVDKIMSGTQQNQAGMILVHGRGATAESIMALAGGLDTSGFTILAPQATGNTWYPERFLAPLERNEPWLSVALKTVGDCFVKLEQDGIPADKVILLGFSQGACLALEYAARNACRYGGVVALSGALIGPDGLLRNDQGSLAGTPVFLGCSDVDFHIPRYRVEQAAETLRKLGGKVTVRLYPGLDHSVNEDELVFVQGMLDTVRA